MSKISAGGLDDPRVVGLLAAHVTAARAHTAAGSAHALDLAGLRAADIDFWTLWEGGAPVAVGALKRLSREHGEVKSMHTAEAMRGRGYGAAMLKYIVSAARAQGMSRLSLETGSWAYFEAARELYRRHGFTECPPFADYVPDPNSVFMALDL